MSDDITIMRHRDPTGEVLKFDFSSEIKADAWVSCAQMFVTLLLTDKGSVPSDPKMGTTFLSDLKSGRIYNDGLLKSSFEFAAMATFNYLAVKGYDHTVDLDNQLAEVNLLKWGLPGAAPSCTWS